MEILKIRAKLKYLIKLNTEGKITKDTFNKEYIELMNELYLIKTKY